MRKFRTIRGGKSREAEFERFIALHFDALYRRAYRLTRDADDAEDLVQELCIRAYRAFDDVKNMDNPRAWLLRVLYRLFVDFARHNACSPVRALSVVEEDGSSIDVASAEPGPAEHMETDLLRERLHRALKVLRPEEQALLVMHEVEGYSLAEIEEITELPPSTVKSRLHRARVKLGRLLRHAEHEATTNSRGSHYELPRRHRSVG